MVSSPSPPDPMETAQAQSGMNRDTALQQQQLKMVNQVGPTGTLTHEQTGTSRFKDSQGNWVETPTYTATTAFTPEQQKIFDKTQAAQSNLAGIAEDQTAFIGDYLDKPFEYNNQDAENWAYDLASQRILPQQQQATDQLRTQLISQGLRPGTAAYEREMTRLTQNQGDQLNQLALSGRRQAYTEALQERNQPLNEISALLSGSQVSMPQFQQTPQTGVAGVDYTGLVNSNYQAQVSNNNAMMGGLFGLAAAPFGMFNFKSDRRAKKHIRQIGTLPNGLPWYEFRYLTDGDETPIREGVMSDDVRKVMPSAVSVDADGLDMVDYAQVLEAA